MMSRYFTKVSYYYFRRTQYITSIGMFYKNCGFYLEVFLVIVILLLLVMVW